MIFVGMLLRPLFAVAVMLIVGCAAVAQRPTLYVQTGHEGPINCIAYSPDGSLMASGGEDTTIKLWDVATRREVRTIAAHEGRITGIAFDPSGTMLASSSADGRVVVSNVATGARMWVVGQSTPFLAVAFSPDGRYLGAYGSDIVVWDAKTWRDVRHFKGDAMLMKMGIAFGARSVPFAFSSDGKRVFALSEGQPKSFDIESGKKLKTFKEYMFTALAVSPDGNFLALGRNESAAISENPPQFRNYGAIAVFDTVSGKLVKKWEAHPGDEHSGDVTALSFSRDSKVLASAGYDKAIRLWDVPTWREIKAITGSKDWINSICFSRDGHTLASASGSSSVVGFESGIRLWNVSTGESIANFAARTSRAYGVAVSPDGRRIASLTTDTRKTVITIWDLKLGQKIHVFEVPFWLFSVVYSPTSTTLVAGCRDGTAKLLDANTGEILRAFGPHSDTVFCAAFSRDGNRLATAGADKGIKIWDVRSGRELFTLNGHTDNVLSVAFSPNGQLLASTAMDKSIRLWDLNSETQVKSLINPLTDLQIGEIPPQTQLIGSMLNGDLQGGGIVTFSPDGKTLSASVGGYVMARVGSEEKAAKITPEIRLYDVASGNEVRRLTGIKDTIRSLEFSSDGHRLVSAGADKIVSLWDVSTGRKMRTLENNLDFDTYAAFIPSGDLITGVSRGLLSLWDANSGELLTSMTAVEGTTEWLVVTPDGLFDGSPKAWRQLLWRFSDKTSDVLSVESYFGEFFYPNLLADIYAGHRPRAQAKIENKDRRQPLLKLALPEMHSDTISSRELSVQIELTEAAVENTRTTGGGVRDVRLFRNGSLVRSWRGELALRGGKATVEATIPFVAGENVLTAYAFNDDNVKSEDATLTVTGAQSLQRQGTAYVLAIGVNGYANSQYNLKYAVADAKAFREEFSRQQLKLGRFANVEVIPLIDRDATKANILAALKRLASSDNAPLPPGTPPMLQSLHGAQPEDAVVVYFAGHGTAQQNQFFLVPYDLGYQGSRTQLDRTALDTILAHSISDRELEQAFEQVDAGQILLIIDACNSGQALEAEEKRRGPMNSKGLAQLAYEKGMYVLTAAQSYQAALETPQHGHGYLTYALVEDGLKTANADIDPRDGEVTVREWLDFASQRVPQLQEEDAKRPKQIALINQEQASQQKLTSRQQRGRQATRKARQQVDVEKARQFERDKSQVPAPGKSEENLLQQPRVFYRREVESRPLVVARPQ